VENVGTVVHTGDWKLDPDPVLGHKTDAEALRKLGDKGVLAVMGDSTNAMVPGHSGSERDVANNLMELFSEFKEGAIAISCFSTNVARLVSIYEAAEKNGRHVCLIGRSLWNIDDAARKSGYLKGIKPFLTDEEANLHPIERILYVCTGSQGEPRAALSRISNDDHPALGLQEGDVVIFSSRAIPGNERAIDRIKNRLYVKGVNIVTDRDAPIHVSGHPYRDELKQMYAWLRPRFAVPVHGEQMQMEKHAELARECGVSDTLIPEIGKVIRLTPDSISVAGEVPSGVLAIEGNRIVAVDHEAILTRKRMMWNGSAVVTVVVDRKGKLMAPPKITALGLLDEMSEHDAVLLNQISREVSAKIENAPQAHRADDDVLNELVRVTARRFFQEKLDRKPQTRVHLVRI
jgi:ribonuclease J